MEHDWCYRFCVLQPHGRKSALATPDSRNDMKTYFSYENRFALVAPDSRDKHKKNSCFKNMVSAGVPPNAYPGTSVLEGHMASVFRSEMIFKHNLIVDDLTVLR